ncbi:MAG: urease accessory protein [Kangiella sp.]|nr:MAG: urease accessory protein [Kangiella sp.]
MLSLLLLGFLFGMKHALEADHVAAVASLVTKTTSIKEAIKLGSFWGLGHTITLFIIGSVILLTDLFIPKVAAGWLELFVGVMLVILGIDVLYRLYKDKIHFHSHKHTKQPLHFHAHSHKSDKTPANERFTHEDSKAHDHQHFSIDPLSYRALFVGVLHGVAGSAALILLTLESIKSVSQGLIFISLFGLGSILGMAILSYIISIPLRNSAKGLTWMNSGLQSLIGISTIILGSYVLFDNARFIAML